MNVSEIHLTITGRDVSISLVNGEFIGGQVLQRAMHMVMKDIRAAKMRAIQAHRKQMREMEDKATEEESSEEQVDEDVQELADAIERLEKFMPGQKKAEQ